MALRDLTRRQREVLGHIARGRSDKEIAERIGIAENTLKFHTGRIYGRLGLGEWGNARVRAALWYWRQRAAEQPDA